MSRVTCAKLIDLGIFLMYNEIHKSDSGYEIHVLFQNKGLINFTVNVKDVEYAD
jgi:hypothetical protein